MQLFCSSDDGTPCASQARLLRAHYHDQIKAGWLRVGTVAHTKRKVQRSFEVMARITLLWRMVSTCTTRRVGFNPNFHPGPIKGIFYVGGSIPPYKQTALRRRSALVYRRKPQAPDCRREINFLKLRAATLAFQITPACCRLSEEFLERGSPHQALQRFNRVQQGRSNSRNSKHLKSLNFTAFHQEAKSGSGLVNHLGMPEALVRC